ncbi:hypothetical protein PINS_up021811 [Pythium insidiosum]|nr:hypothetical protein PINS_up007611 [Pythium insidiosum]GLE09883.1 hypothetical protein PINS_up021811 [Pythium insidiosum]
MYWTPIATGVMMASSAATFFTMLDLRLRWDVHASSVRWLFWLFFLYVFIWCLARSIFFFWWSMYPDCIEERAPEDIAQSPDRLDFRTLFEIREASTLWMSVIICIGDVALMAIGLTIFPLTYELWNLARLSMDRGVEKEQKQIWKYSWIIHGLVVVFALTELAIAMQAGRHTLNTHLCLLATYVVQMVGMVFMVGLLLRLRINGRKYETIHGTFIASPVYQRLKRIMLVYATFSFQCQLLSFILYVRSPEVPAGTVLFLGMSRILYNASGLALAVTTSCSQRCVIRAFGCCFPEDVEAQLEHNRLCAGYPSPVVDIRAPDMNPVFVYSDIQSSSALWGLGDGHMMDAATELHDNILRSALPKHRGYEITTVGDAFQLAFHSIKDAVEYCMDVQLQLLMAKWPKELHEAVPATHRVRSGRRLIFSGLRVRMGIHDAAEVEGTLVRGTHAVTGKTTYTGVSEVIAEYVGDLGSGGQILVTERVAAWLRHHKDDVSSHFVLDRLGVYTVPQVNVDVDVFQVMPSMLSARMPHFPVPEKSHPRLEHPARPPRKILVDLNGVEHDYALLESARHHEEELRSPV